MSDLAKARKALDDALDELAVAARDVAKGGARGESDGVSGESEGRSGELTAALQDAEAERDALAKQLVDMQAERAKDAAMIEDALADLRAIA